MSWSSDRNEMKIKNKEKIINQIININNILRQLAIDSNLTEDLLNETVLIAIKHWTNEKRLNIEEAKKLEDNYYVLAVLKKLVNFFFFLSFFFVSYFLLFLAYFTICMSISRNGCSIRSFSFKKKFFIIGTY